MNSMYNCILVLILLLMDCYSKLEFPKMLMIFCAKQKNMDSHCAASAKAVGQEHVSFQTRLEGRFERL